jgi:anti-sigma regulatory factor (Ser/Thr protein kinase)
MAREHVSVTVPTHARFLASVRQFYTTVLQAHCGAVHCDPALVDDLVLALDECCTNLIKHRSQRICDGAIHIEGTLDGSSVHFRIPGFCLAEDRDKIKPRNLEDVRPGGLGTHFVQRIMDRVTFEPDAERPECLALLLEKSLLEQHD